MSFNPEKPYRLPPLPSAWDFEDIAVYKILVNATRELAHLNGFCLAMQNPSLLISPAILRESIASSEIEAIHTTMANALQAEVFPELEKPQPDKEVLHYRDAVHWAAENRKKYAISSRLITGIHRKLLPDSQGYRRSQNQILDATTRKAVYTPPRASELAGLMGNWERFANPSGDLYDRETLHSLLRSAVCHYQFEAIHPFLDGNGRTGRILMVLQLMEEKLLDHPVLFISGYLSRNKDEYYKLLRAVTTDARWKEFALFILQGVWEQSLNTQKTLLRIQTEYWRARTMVKAKVGGRYGAELVDHIFSHPVTIPVRLGRALDVHYTTATKYLEKLEKLKLVREKRQGKYRLFINAPLMKVMQG